MKEIYEAQIVYHVNFFKKRFLLPDVEYTGEVFIPLQNYILAFSEQNAKDKVIYSNFWQYDFAGQKLLEDYNVKDFELKNKFVEVKKVKNKDLRHLVENMDKKDFLEWLHREEEGNA